MDRITPPPSYSDLVGQVRGVFFFWGGGGGGGGGQRAYIIIMLILNVTTVGLTTELIHVQYILNRSCASDYGLVLY